jgi:hypothetical protein
MTGTALRRLAAPAARAAVALALVVGLLAAQFAPAAVPSAAAEDQVYDPPPRNP